MTFKSALPLIGIVALTLLVGPNATTPRADAQSAQQQQTTVKIYSLRYAEADQLASVLSRLVDDAQIVADSQTNSLLVRTLDDDAMIRVAGLIEQLDVSRGESSQETKILRLRYRTAAAVEPIARMHLSPSGRLAINQQTNSIVVSDSSERVAAAMRIIESLDVEPATLNVDFWLLGSSQGSPVETHQALSGLAAELERIGLDDYGVFSHAAVRALEGNHFVLSQTFTQRKLRGIDLNGEARLERQGDQAILKIDSRLQLDLGAEAQTQLTLGTTVKTRIGDLVVLGLAPTGNESSKPIAMVVRVSR